MKLTVSSPLPSFTLTFTKVCLQVGGASDSPAQNLRSLTIKKSCMFANVNYTEPIACFNTTVDSFRKCDFQKFLFWVLAAAHVLKWFGRNDIELINDYTKQLRDVLVPHIFGGVTVIKTRRAQAARYVTCGRELYFASTQTTKWCTAIVTRRS